VDAWWEPEATAEQRAAVIATVQRVLSRFGQTRTRTWGDVVSVDVQLGNRAAFSFQVASRSVRLEPPYHDPDSGIMIDRLSDLIASKMVALVERGAPRDFRDVHEVCAAGLVTPADCWRLWRQRQMQGGSDADPHRARLAIDTHLQRIAQHRPLALIQDSTQQAEAARVRTWFAEVMLHADAP
jgi:hypothetical protein